MPRTAFGILWRFSLALILAMLTLRLTWGWYVDRATAKYLASIRARGEPVTESDLTYNSDHDPNDAWPLIYAAAQAITFDSPRSTNMTFREYPPFPPEWMKIASESQVANGKAFELMDEAMSKPKLRLPRKVASPTSAYNNSRRLVNTLADAALFDHVNGRNVDAIRRVEQIYAVARHLRVNEDLIAQLVAGSIDGIGNYALLTICAGSGRSAQQPVSPDQLRRLLGILIDEDQELWRLVRASFLRARVNQYDNAGSTLNAVWLTRPLAKHELLEYLRHCDVWHTATEHRTAPDIVRALAIAAPGFEWRRRELSTRGVAMPVIPFNDFAQFDPVPFARYVETEVRIVADRRTAATALACHLFRLQKNQFPKNLAELVPDYLSALPKDPFHSDGRPIGYEIKHHPDGTQRPVVYFDVGDEVPLRDEPTFSWHPGIAGKHIVRQYRDLALFAPASTTQSSQGGERDPNEPGAPGE